MIASFMDFARKRREAREAIFTSARAKIEICEVLGLAAGILSPDGRIIETNAFFHSAFQNNEDMPPARILTRFRADA